MSNTIATASGQYGEYRLIETVDEVQSDYRLDMGGIQSFFDEVDTDNSRQTFSLYRFGDHVTTIDASVLPDRVEGALAVLARS